MKDKVSHNVTKYFEFESLNHAFLLQYEVKYDIPERILFMALESVLFDEEQANNLM